MADVEDKGPGAGDETAAAGEAGAARAGGAVGADGAVGEAGAVGADGVTRHYTSLSVIVPVYNERATVAEVIRRIRAVDLPLTVEVIAVDDGSTDGTDKVLATVQDSTVRVLVHAENRGKGAAIRTGLAVARGDLVLIQDADLEYDPEDWGDLLAPILRGKARVVYGSRFTGQRKNMLPLHWIGNRFLSLVTNVLYSSTLSDMETCYKLFDRQAIEGITIKSDRFDFEPEITARSSGAATASTRYPSRTRAGRLPRGRRSPGGTGSGR